jgi:gluconolactonase
MHFRRILLAFGLILPLAAAGGAQSPPATERAGAIPGGDPAAALIPGIGPLGPVAKIATDFVFTEGAASRADGEYLFFNDIRNNRTWRYTIINQKLEPVREDNQAANGMMMNTAGELVTCEMGAGRVTAFNPTTAQLRVLADQFEGKRFNACNDLVIDRQGGIYFTDPGFGAPNPLPQGTHAVYYLSPDGTVARLIEDLNAPNGIILSPDETTLYVAPTFETRVVAYSVEAPGKLGPGRTLCELELPEGKTQSGADGVSIDVQGNLYATTAAGIQVIAPDGRHLGIIEVPEQPANCAFGGPDFKTLFITARTSVYAAPMAVAGHRFAVAVGEIGAGE